MGNGRFICCKHCQTLVQDCQMQPQNEALISVWAVDFLEAKPLNISWEWQQRVIQEVLAKRRNDLNIELESLFYVSNKKRPIVPTITTTYQTPCLKHNIDKSLQNSELISIFFDVKRRKCYIVL